ncbi:MAG TPA: ATP-binding protein [Pyrinomonadaceae bacterium]
MGIRPKFLLLFLAIGVAPLVALSIINYRSSVGAVETGLRDELRRETAVIAQDIEERLREREEALSVLARSKRLRDYVAGNKTGAEVPLDLQAEVGAILQAGEKYYVSLLCLGVEKQPLFRAELNFKAAPPVLFRTEDFLTGGAGADERVWTTPEGKPLRAGVTRESYGSAVRYTIPIFIEQPSINARRGALVVEVKLDALLGDAASLADLARGAESSPTSRLVVILSRAGEVVHHTNSAFKYQPVGTALPPSFKPIADAMSSGQSGWQFFESADGNQWMAAYQVAAPLELSVSVASDYSAAVRSPRRLGLLSVGLTILLGLLTLALLLYLLRRTARSIERVTEGAVAIAGGKLDERIEVRSSDETRLLAESFNAMTERLREQIAHEAEVRQFESFMRLSAILTHDLKNSILALSLLVSNMEERFHNEEFRADAMRSLTEATDKLRALVARLSEPVRSLSGEFKRPLPTDLVPIIRRVMARVVGPAAAGAHLEVETRLPSSLVAIADEGRIERVIENLLLNSLEAMGTKGGKLTVEAGPIEEGFVSFAVSDTGPGMSEEFQRTKLFRPFATTKAKGVGLGLYTCRELVNALGGRIDVESERGSGTSFRVVLPSGQIKESALSESDRAG